MLGHGETRTMAHLDPRINKVMVPTALDQLLDVQTEWVWRLALDGVLAVAWIIRALDRRLIWSTVDNGSSLQIQGPPLFPTLGAVDKPLLSTTLSSLHGTMLGSRLSLLSVTLVQLAELPAPLATSLVSSP